MKTEVRNIFTYKIKFHGRGTLLLHDVPFSLDIQRNLVYVVVLFKLGFSLNFHGSSLSIYSDTYSSSFVSGKFMILDTRFCIR